MEESISFGLYNVWGTTHFSEGIKGIDKYCKIFEPFLEPEKTEERIKCYLVLFPVVNLNLGPSYLIATVIFGDGLPFNLRLNSSGSKKN